MSRVGALSECPFQGDESIHSAGNGTCRRALHSAGAVWRAYGTRGGGRWQHTALCSCLSRSSCPHAGGRSCTVHMLDQEQPRKVMLLVASTW